MTNSLDQEIRLWIARYLRGEVPLDVFEEWFTPSTWDVDEGDAVVRGMTDLVAFRLAEYTSGDLSEEELRGELRPLVGSLEPEPVTTFSSSDLSPTSTSFGAGTRRSTVFG